MRAHRIVSLLAIGLTIAGAPVAATEFDSCIALVRQQPDDSAAYACFFTTARELKRWDTAVQHLEALLSVDPELAWPRYYLARVLQDLGDPRTEATYAQAVAAIADGHDPAALAEARTSFAHFLKAAGRLDEAEAQISAAEEAARSTGDPLVLGRTRMHRGFLLLKRSEYSAALVVFKDVESLVFPDGAPKDKGMCLGGLASAYYRTNEDLLALETYARSARQYELAGDTWERSKMMFNRAMVAQYLFKTGRMEHQATVDQIEEALEAATQAGMTRAEARAHSLLAEMTAGTVSLRHSESAFSALRESDHVWSMIHAGTAHAIGLIQNDAGDTQEGFRLFDEIDRIAAETGNPAVIADTRVALARQHRKHGKRTAAIRESLRALDAVEAARDLQADESVRARFFSNRAIEYAALADYLLTENGSHPSNDEIDLAFTVIERMRSRVLLDHLDAARVTELIAHDHPLRVERDELLEQLAEVQTRVADPGLPAAERRQSLRILERLEDEESRLRTELARVDSRFATLRCSELPELAEVRAELEPDEALLSYQVVARHLGRSRVVVHTRGATRAYRLDALEQLDEELELFFGLIDRRDGAEREGAVRLYEKLVSAGLDDLPPEVDRLIVVPDQLLHVLPFGALRSAADEEPLAARFEISVVPSASLWLRWRRMQPATGPVAVLALADPELEFGHDHAAETRDADWTSGVRLGELPHARDEVRFVARALAGDSLVLTGRRASESYLKSSELNRFGILHLAAHSWIDEKRPERSAVFLAPGDTDQDGLLQLRDIVGLDLTGRVVVL